MTVKPAVVETTIVLRDDSEQLHSDLKRLMQELFPEEWGSLDADRMQVPKSATPAAGKQSLRPGRCSDRPPLACLISHTGQGRITAFVSTGIRDGKGSPTKALSQSLTVQITKIGGGITNVLLKVAAPKGSGIESAIVRVFGDNTEMYIDRDREIQVLLRLNEAGFGAKASLFCAAAMIRSQLKLKRPTG